jgi:hypothetical protein
VKERAPSTQIEGDRAREIKQERRYQYVLTELESKVFTAAVMGLLKRHVVREWRRPVQGGKKQSATADRWFMGERNVHEVVERLISKRMLVPANIGPWEAGREAHKIVDKRSA